MKLTVHAEGTPQDIAAELTEVAKTLLEGAAEQKASGKSSAAPAAAKAAKKGAKAAKVEEDDDLELPSDENEEFDLGDEDGLEDAEVGDEDSDDLGEEEVEEEEEKKLDRDADVAPAVRKHLEKLKKKYKGDAKKAHADIKKIFGKFGATKLQEVKEKHFAALIKAVS